jgi:phosphatidate phosphatase PAH1
LVFKNRKQHVLWEAGIDFLSILYLKLQTSKGPTKIQPVEKFITMLEHKPLSQNSILILYVQSQQHVWQKIPQWCKKHSNIWNEKQGDAINMTHQWSNNLGLKSFKTYQMPYIISANVTIFANKIEEHRELGEIQCIRQSCGHQEPPPWQHMVQQTCGTQKTRWR